MGEETKGLGRVQIVELEQLDHLTACGWECVRLIEDEVPVLVHIGVTHVGGKEVPDETVATSQIHGHSQRQEIRGLRRRVRALIAHSRDEELLAARSAKASAELDLKGVEDKLCAALKEKTAIEEARVRAHADFQAQLARANRLEAEQKEVRDRVRLMERDLAKVRETLGTLEYNRILGGERS